MKGKRFFLIRPSFYAVFSGALLSIAINIFTNLFSIQKEPINPVFLRFAFFIIFTLIISSGSFLYLSLELEDSREKWALSHFLNEIDKNASLRRKLLFLFLVGFISLVLTFTAVIFWLLSLLGV
jgi:hypothetical protein